MYKSIEKIRQLRTEKQAVLRSVYKGGSPDDIYKKQSALGSMSISIFTDVANVLLPALQEDGVGNIVWSSISLRLEKLSFISVPTSTEIREKYKESMDHPTVVNIDGEAPKPRTRTKVKKISLPKFLTVLAIQGIAIPLLLHTVGGTKLALVKILCVVNAVFMIIEVIKYFDLLPSKPMKPLIRKPRQEPVPADYEDMYREAIREVYRDNCRRLDDWFDVLERITTEETNKALGKAED